MIRKGVKVFSLFVYITSIFCKYQNQFNGKVLIMLTCAT